MNDNRRYIYSRNSISKRVEYETVAQLIKKGSSAVDLACGDGTLLSILKEKRAVKGFGIEVSASGVRSTRAKKIKVIQGRIDQKLPFKDKEFDYAICNVTLHMVMYPEILINEMVRISKKQIITFPNFAYILNRLELLFKGRMPKFMLNGYQWYSTGEIHQLSLSDFTDFCKENAIQIISTNHFFPDRLFIFPAPLLKLFPNLFAGKAVFVTKNGKI